MVRRKRDRLALFMSVLAVTLAAAALTFYLWHLNEMTRIGYDPAPLADGSVPMIDPHRKRVNRRTAWTVLFFGLWTGLLVFRLVQLQVLRHARYKTEVIEQSRNKRPVWPRRGTLTDRNGDILVRSL